MEEKHLKAKAVSGFFWKIGERLAAQMVSFVVTIIIARLLMPEDYAPIAILSIFISIANVFIIDGFCAALVQKRNVDFLDYSSVLIAGMGFAICIYIMLFFAAPYVARFYSMPILTSTLRALALRIPLSAINSVEIAYLTKNMQFKAFFWGTFIGTVVSAVVGISSAICGLGTWALVIQNLTNYTIDTLVLFLIIKKIPPLKFSMKRVKPLLQYGYKILLNSLFYTFIEHSRSLIIGKKYSAGDLAFYTKGRQLPQLVAACVSAPMTSVMFPTMSAVNEDIGKVKSVFRRSIKVLTYVIYPLLFGLAAVSYNLIKLILTEKWVFSARFLIIFCFYYLFQPIHSLNQEAVKAIGRGDQVLKYGIFHRIVNLAVIIATVWFSPYIIAWGMVINALISTAINAYQNKQLFAYSYSEQLSDWLPNLMIGFTMFIIVYFTEKILKFNYIAVLAFQICEGVITYILLSVLTKNQNFFFILNYIRERMGTH